MKKTLVSALSAALVVGAASTTFAAANPFSDVPANSWAYNAVATLAKDGVVNGFPNGTFQGQKTMTRYEMAQIVAKAMAYENMTKADKAIVDKLAVEFNAELQNLGVRVGNLEKKSDNVKLGGKVEYNYTSWKTNPVSFNSDAKAVVSKSVTDHSSNLKFRLEPTVFINDKITGHARMDYDLKPEKDSDNGNKVTVDRVYVEGQFGKVGVTAGKLPFATAQNLVFDSKVTGVAVKSSVKALDVAVVAGRVHDAENKKAKESTLGLYGVEVTGKIGKNLKLTAGYDMLRGIDKVGNTELNPVGYDAFGGLVGDAAQGTDTLTGETLTRVTNEQQIAAGLVPLVNPGYAPYQQGDLTYQYSGKFKSAVQNYKKAVNDVANVSTAYKAYIDEKVATQVNGKFDDYVTPLILQVEKDTGDVVNEAANQTPDYSKLSATAKDYKAAVDAYNQALKDMRNQNIWYVAAHYDVDKNVNVEAAYAKNTKADDLNTAYTAVVNYKGEDATKAGSFGVWAGYRNIGNFASLHDYDEISRGQKGLVAGAAYVPAENVVAKVRYFNGKNIVTDKKASKLWTTVEFLF